MGDEKKIQGLRTVVMFVATLLMVITVILQMAAFEPIRHVILCSSILLFVIVTMILDVFLKDKQNVIRHVFWFALWFVNLIMNLSKI